MEKGLMQRMKDIVGDWNRLVQGKQLFRVLCGSFGVISEQRAVGAWRICKRIDESAIRARCRGEERQNPAIIWK